MLTGTSIPKIYIPMLFGAFLLIFLAADTRDADAWCFTRFAGPGMQIGKGHPPAGAPTPPPPPPAAPTPVPTGPAPTPTPSPSETPTDSNKPEPPKPDPTETSTPPAQDDSSSPRKMTATMQIEMAAYAWESWWSYNQDTYIDLKRAYPFEKVEGLDDKDEARTVMEKEYNALWKFLIEELKPKEPDTCAAAIAALARSADKNALIEFEKLIKPSDVELSDWLHVAWGFLKDSSKRAEMETMLRDKKAKKQSRCFAGVGLGFLGGEDSVQALKDIISDEGEVRELRCVCVMALTNFDKPDTSKFLSEIAVPPDAKGKDKFVRACAVAGLGKMTECPEATILSALNDESAEIRRSAAIAAGTKRIRSVRDKLAEMMKKDRDPIARCFATIGIGRIADPTDARLLIEALNSNECLEIQGFAAIAIGISGTKDEAMLSALRGVYADNRKLEPVRCAAALALGLLRDEASLPNIVKLAEKKQYPTLRKYSIFALGLIGKKDKQTIALIKEVAADSKKKAPDAYKSAIMSLILLGEGKAAVKELKEDLISVDGLNAKMPIIDLAGRFGDAGTGLALIELCKKEKKDFGRTAYICAIGCLIDRNHKFPLLRNLLADTNYYIQPEAITEMFNKFP